MNEQTAVWNSSQKMKLLSVMLCLIGLVACVAFTVELYGRHRTNAEVERIEQAENCSDVELESNAQGGDPYAQYALGSRIYDMICRWKAGANNREDGKCYDANIWIGDNVQVAWNRLQKLAQEGNDYARYSLEECVSICEVEKRGENQLTRKRPRPLNDYRLLDYSGQLLLAAIESALEKDMHRWFVQKVGHKLVQWRFEARFFQTPLVKEPDFVRRWEMIAERCRKIVKIPKSP